MPQHYYENNIKAGLPITLTEDNVVAILPKGHGDLIDKKDLKGVWEWDPNIEDVEPVLKADDESKKLVKTSNSFQN